MRLIVIDAGHGGSDPGAIGLNGVKEKDITLKLAQKVGNLLAVQGINVAYTRTTDIFMGNAHRAAIANNAQAEYFISIHINSAQSITATGTETYALTAGGKGEKLAEAINTSLVKYINLPNRGVKFANFDVLRQTDMPAALTEICFICNPKEEAMLKDEAFLNNAALGIAKGVTSFIGVTWKDIDLPHLPEIPQWQRDGFIKLVEKGVISSPEYWEPKLSENITVGEIFGILGRMCK